MVIDDRRRVTIGDTVTGAAIATDEGSTRGATIGGIIDVTGFSGDVTIMVTTGEGTTTKVETTQADSIALLR